MSNMVTNVYLCEV